MLRALRTLPIILSLLVASSSPSVFANNNEVTLTGLHVASIADMFLRNHYSQERFNDDHSRRMLELYISRYDPGHYYFLQSDIKAFNRYSTRLDDMMRRGDIEPAFTIYDRFVERMNEREAFIKKALQKSFDLKTEDTFQIDRKDAPYPANTTEADQLWAKRLKFELLELTLNGDDLKTAKEALQKRYRSIHFRYSHFEHNDVVTAYLNAFTASYDPHSSYLTADDLENFNIAMRLSLEGIGATLRWEDGHTIISSIIPGGAAARDGTLRPEDKIVAVGQGKKGAMEDVTNLRLIDVVKLIRGERGTLVRLAYLRKTKGSVEKRQEVSIVRDKIVLRDGEAKGEVLEHASKKGDPPLKIGVIHLPSFYVDFSGRQTDPEHYKSSSRDVDNILEGFVRSRVDGVILDLRNNGGGGLDEAVSLAGLFLDPGPIVMVKNIRGDLSVYRNPHHRPVYKGPLIVLVNRYSASASEIVAGALQDYGRAIIVGDKSTFGKGTVQNVITLANGWGGLKTTVAKFYRPGSASTQNRGVESDIVLPSMNNYLDIGESSLENAMPWDTVRRAVFRPWGEFGSVLPVLRERSRRRVAASPYFQQVETDIHEYLANRKNRKDVTVTQLIKEHELQVQNGHANKPADHALSTTSAEKDNGQGDDQVLQESVNIISDYIQIKNRATRNTVASESG